MELGASQESRAQPVVLRQERRAAPRDPRSDTQGDEAGLDVSGVPSPPQYESLVEWELCGVDVGLGAEPGGCAPRNRSTNSLFCTLKETALEICPSFRVSSWLP